MFSEAEDAREEHMVQANIKQGSSTECEGERPAAVYLIDV